VDERSSEIALIHKAQALNLKKEHRRQSFWVALMWLFGLITVSILILVVGYVLLKGGTAINWEFLTTPPKGGLSGEGGISTTIGTTFYLVGLTLLIATPLGVGAAMFLIEYAGEQSLGSKFLRSMISIANFAVETLAGIPSIIYGLFGYALFVSTLKFGFSLLSAALAGACLVLPTIIRTTEEALLAVPDDYRRGSLALGATKWQTLYRVVLPASARDHYWYHTQRWASHQRNSHFLRDPWRQLSYANFHHGQRSHAGTAPLLPCDGHARV